MYKASSGYPDLSNTATLYEKVSNQCFHTMSQTPDSGACTFFAATVAFVKANTQCLNFSCYLCLRITSKQNFVYTIVRTHCYRCIEIVLLRNKCGAHK